MTSRPTPFGLAIVTIAWLALIPTACKKARKGPASIEVRDRPTLKLESQRSLIKNSPVTDVIPRQATMVLSIGSYAWFSRSVGLDSLRKRHRSLFDKSAKNDFVDAADLGALTKAGIDINGPLTLLEVGGFSGINVSILKLTDAKALQAAFKAKFPKGLVTVIGETTILHHPDEGRTLVRRGWAIQLETKKSALKPKIPALALFLASLSPADSLAKSATFRQLQRQLDYGKDLFLFVNLPQLMGRDPGGLSSSVLGGIGALGIGANLKGGTIVAKFTVAMPQKGPLRRLLKRGTPPIGWTVLDKRPSFALRLQLDFDAMLKQLADPKSAAMLRQLKTQLTAPTPLGTNGADILKMFTGKIEAYVTLAPTIVKDRSAYEAHALLQLADVKGVQSLLAKLSELAASEIGVKKTAEQRWYAIYIPPIKKTIRFGVLQSHLVVTTDEALITRMAKGERSSFVDKLANPTLKTMFRANDVVFYYLDGAAIARLAEIGSKKNSADDVFIATARELGTLAVAVDGIGDALSGPIVLQLSSPSLAAWLEKVMPLFIKADELAKKRRNKK
ncbi:MAG: hypothetical protein KC609_05690 [Myxococcales bacterium]|nr:hypothetical protein [Myxococcales bacterium]